MVSNVPQKWLPQKQLGARRAAASPPSSLGLATRGRLLQKWGMEGIWSPLSTATGMEISRVHGRAQGGGRQQEEGWSCFVEGGFGGGDRWQRGICPSAENCPSLLPALCLNVSGQLLPGRTSALRHNQPLAAGSSFFWEMHWKSAILSWIECAKWVDLKLLYI